MQGSLDLTGRTVLVTGGTRGVGRGIAELFLTHGADVVVSGRNTPETPPSAGGRNAQYVAADVRDVDSVRAMVEATVATFERLDIVINNAGGTPPAFVAGTSPRFLTSVITLNLLAPLYVAQQANDLMQAGDGGSIINICSVNGLGASPGAAAYGAAKAGLINLTQSLAVEFAPKVRVNAVTAGIVGTDEIFKTHFGDDQERISALRAGVPLGRLATPEDVAAACVFLASDMASHIAGANILVHGGGEPPGTLPERPER
ncbi:MAG: SDR family oxidoreductase [Actinomycetota bacterium]|nr:SDR family oxidoreductase [Actinomycetota bacterium]